MRDRPVQGVPPVDGTPSAVPDLLAKRPRLHVTRLVALLIVAGVVSVPFVARLVDRTADSIAAKSSPVWLVMAWTVNAVLASAVVVHVLRRLLHLPSGGGFALAYDSLPFSLLLAWVVLFGALLTRHRLLATTAGLLCLYHVLLMGPRARSARRPRWVRHAPLFRLGVANVFVDNPTPERSAAGLIDADVDALVINESNPTFLEAFDRLGGRRAFPFRLTDPSDTGTYAITVVSRRPFLPGTRFTMIGSLRAAEVHLATEGTPFTLLAIHAYASLEPKGYVLWAAQMQALRDHLRTARPRQILAGDFNTTHFRPEFMELLATGARDAHDTLGRGWSRSIKIRATGLLSSLGPIARLDHAVLTDGVWPMDVRNLPARGSDHLPFVLTAAIRPEHFDDAEPAEKGTTPTCRRGAKDRSTA